MQQLQINTFNFTHEQTVRPVSKPLHSAPALGNDLRAGATQNRGAQSATSYKNTAKVSFLTENKTSNLSVRQNKAGSLKLTSVTVSRN